MKKWLALLLLAGCGFVGSGLEGTRAEKPRQTEAQAIVWEQTYHEPYAETPAVRWVEGADLSCTDPNSGRPGFRLVTGECREGQTLVPGTVQVAWRPEDVFSTTTLAHEDWHAALMYHGRLDPGHAGAGWRPLDGCPPAEAAPAGECGVVEYANRRLVAAGL